MLNQEELKRLHIIKKVSEGILKQKDAAEMLLISDRQVRNLYQIEERIKLVKIGHF